MKKALSVLYTGSRPRKPVRAKSSSGKGDPLRQQSPGLEATAKGNDGPRATPRGRTRP